MADRSNNQSDPQQPPWNNLGIVVAVATGLMCLAGQTSPDLATPCGPSWAASDDCGCQDIPNDVDAAAVAVEPSNADAAWSPVPPVASTDTYRELAGDAARQRSIIAHFDRAFSQASLLLHVAPKQSPPVSRKG